MNTNNPTNSESAKTMADLLKAHNSSFISLKKGESVKGKITKLTSSEILLDINTKTEAVVLEKEKRIVKQLLSLLKVGDTVTATVLNPESDLGFPVVSLRRFIDDKLWERLEYLQKHQEKIDVFIKESTKGGFLADTEDGLTGFLPNSHISFTQNQQDLLGKKISVIVVELNREIRKVIFSQKAIMGDMDFKEAMRVIKQGQKIKVKIISITSFGIFTQVPITQKEDKFIDGLIHISEISWDKVSDISEKFKIGDTIEAVVIAFDHDAKRIDLSIKRLTQDPFEELVKHYSLDQKVTGTITKISDTGITLQLVTEDQKIEGIIRKDKIPPTVIYNEGQKITATVSQIDSKKRRLILVPVLLEKPIGYR